MFSLGYLVLLLSPFCILLLICNILYFSVLNEGLLVSQLVLKGDPPRGIENQIISRYDHSICNDIKMESFNYRKHQAAII